MNKPQLSIAALACAALFWAAHSAPVQACDTPVYRYSMYSWEPAPYTIYVLHDGDPSAAQPLQAAVNELNADLSADTVNLWCVPVDLSNDPELRTVPPPVAAAWASESDQTLPRCLVMSPKGGLLSDDMLAPEDLAALIDSPARQEIADQLADAKVGVFVFLTSSDEAADERAQRETQAFISALADGVTELLEPIGPPGYVPEENAPDSRVEVGFVKVDRDDPNEQWLVRMLLNVEPDLANFDQPMVFGVFGRCRALEPYVGDGVIMENLAEGIDFIRGACSCTVRDENPGLDMLTHYNWEKAAAIMAERFGAEEGSLQHLSGGGVTDFPGGIFPEIIPLEPSAGGSDQAPVRRLSPETIEVHGGTAGGDESDTSQDLAEASEETEGDAVAEVEETVVEGEAATESSEDLASTASDAGESVAAEEIVEAEIAPADETDVAASPADETETATASSDGEGEEVASAATTTTSTSSAEEPGMATGLLWTLLIGAGIGLALLLGATFFLFRPTA